MSVALTQLILVSPSERSWTVLGDDLLPIQPVETYLEHLRQTGSSPNTVRAYARSLCLWWDFLTARNRSWSQLQLDDVTGFLGWMRSGLPAGVASLRATASVSDATISLRLQAVRSFYRFHQERGVSSGVNFYSARERRSPYRGMLDHTRRVPREGVTVRVRQRRAQAPTLTVRQIELIKDAAGRYDTGAGRWSGSVRDRFFFSLLEETGLRIGEALSLQHRDWHTGGGENPFLEVVPRPHPLGARVKGGRYRKLYVSDALDRLYAEYVWDLCDQGMDLAVDDMDSAYVLVTLRGATRFHPLRPETIYKLIGRISRQLGDDLPEAWTPHWFRHTHATALLLSGRPVHVVSRRLGHADVQTTLNTYAWVTEDDELRALAHWEHGEAKWRIGDGPTQ